MTQRSSSEAVLAAMVLADGLTSSFGRAEIPLNDGPPSAWAYHQFVRKDGLLGRMAFGRRE